MSRPVALITGGAGGIGAGFVLEAARRGFIPVFSFRSTAADPELIRQCEEHGVAPVPCQADLAERSDIDRLARVAQDAGPVTTLINCAGLAARTGLDSTTDEKLWDLMWVHAYVPDLLTRRLRPDLTASRGSVLNVSSDGGVVGSISGLPYGMSKAATLGATATLARSLAPFVRVNTLAPGAVEAGMWLSASESTRMHVEAETPLQRTPSAEEVAVAGLDICAWHVTGQTIVFNGGRTIL